MNNSTNSQLAAVTGATGFLGAVLCRKLLEDGRRVRAIYRNPQKLESLQDLDVETVQADVTDREAIRAALKGSIPFIMLQPCFVNKACQIQRFGT